VPPKTSAKQPSKPAPGSLEDTLEKALRNSADIKAAEAKVREAEAELNKVRHQVLTKATALHSDLTLAKRMLSVAEQSLARLSELHKSGTVSGEAMMSTESQVTKYRGEVDKLETELKSLRGEFAIKGMMGPVGFDSPWINRSIPYDAVHLWAAMENYQQPSLDRWRPIGPSVFDAYTIKPAAVKTAMAERVRKLLDQEVELSVQNRNISEAFQLLLEVAKTDIPYRDIFGATASDFSLTGKMELGAWFQALEDSDPNVCIVVRDYGLLLTKKDRKPSGAVGVSELWKAKELNPNDEVKPIKSSK
jgi:hypothetical protein